MFTFLEGKAWDCCEHFTLEELASDDGEKMVWAALEKRANDIMGEALGEVFNLAAQESVKQWRARVREVFHTCTRRASVDFPAAARGWIALHCAGVTEEQKGIAKAKASGKLDFDETPKLCDRIFPTTKPVPPTSRGPSACFR